MRLGASTTLLENGRAASFRSETLPECNGLAEKARWVWSLRTALVRDAGRRETVRAAHAGARIFGRALVGSGASPWSIKCIVNLSCRREAS